MLDGDIIVTWGGGSAGGCPDGPLPDLGLCSLSASEPTLDDLSGDYFQILNGDGEDAEEVPDRIRVIGWRIALAVVAIRITVGGAGFAATGILRGFPGQMPDLDVPAQACTAEMIGDMGGLLTPEQQQLIAAFLSSPDAESLWRDSNYTPGVLVGRREQAGFLLPNGTFIPAVTPDANGCTTGAFGFPGPGPIPDGTFLVHTHP